MGKSTHEAEYDLYNKDTGDLIGSVVIRNSWDGEQYVDVYNGDRTNRYEHDHAWSSVNNTSKEMGYHGYRKKD